MKRPKVLILHAAGTNRDHDVAVALSLAGADPDIVHVNALRSGQKKWDAYDMLVVPGGFSYADALGAGRLLALDLSVYFADEVSAFVEAGKPVIGICNGFQALVKAGILPGNPVSFQASMTGGPEAHEKAAAMLSGVKRSLAASADRKVTLGHNERGRFECRWVYLGAPESRCIWTRGIEAPVFCPVAHGEGRFMTANPVELERIRNSGLVALVYANPENPQGTGKGTQAVPVPVAVVAGNGDYPAPVVSSPESVAGCRVPESGEDRDLTAGAAHDSGVHSGLWTPAGGEYPANPNGSFADIAGICNEKGTVLGLMPHPENAIMSAFAPGASRGVRTTAGIEIFKAGVEYARSIL